VGCRPIDGPLLGWHRVVDKFFNVSAEHPAFVFRVTTCSCGCWSEFEGEMWRLLRKVWGSLSNRENHNTLQRYKILAVMRQKKLFLQHPQCSQCRWLHIQALNSLSALHKQAQTRPQSPSTSFLRNPLVTLGKKHVLGKHNSHSLGTILTCLLAFSIPISLTLSL